MAALITVSIQSIQAPTATAAIPPQSLQTPVSPALLNRLPLDMRGAIQHLAAEDHSTRIITSQGSSHVLLRFSDALHEVVPTPGCKCTVAIGSALMPLTKPSAEGTVLA